MVNVSRTFFQDSRIKTIVYETVCGNIPLNSTEIRKQTYQPLNRGFPLLSITTVIFRKKVSFERGKVIKKDVFPSCHERETKKNFPESPSGIEPQIFGFRAQMLYHWAIETPRWAGSTTYTKFIGPACVCRLSPHSWKRYWCPVL